MDEHIKGKWLGVVNAPGDLISAGDGLGTYGVHAALLKSGRVIIWSGRVESSGYLYRSYTWDPTTFTEGDTALTGVEGRWFLSEYDIGGPNESPPGPAPTWDDDHTIDLFCAHHTVLEDGRLLVVGGAGGSTEGDARGNRAIYTYDPDQERWTKAAHLLQRGRWYPTPVTLPDGRVLVVSGRPAGGSGQEEVVEVVSPPDLQSRVVTDAERELFIYPGLVLVRGGRIFYVPTNWLIESAPSSALSKINPTIALRLTGPTSGVWESYPDPTDPSLNVEPINPYREEGTFVLLPPAQAGRILVIGGGFAEDALDSGSDQRSVARIDHCEILETQGTTPRWIEAGTLRFGRVNVHAVLLPDSKVLILGGHSSVKRNPTHVDRLTAEIYDPKVPFDPTDPSAAFTEAASMGRSRNYHATALLLPDGRVLVAGGEDNPHFGGNQTSVELYEPPYFHKGSRPTLAAITTSDSPDKELAYGATFGVTCDDADEAAAIAEVVLMRPGSTTHHTDTEQRHVPLNFSYEGGTTLQVTAPLDPTVAPPGYYMLWIVDGEGRPCKRAKFVRLSHRRCLLVTDRSTISIEEVQALPSRTVQAAIYVHLDGFLPGELGITSPTPTLPLIEAWAPDVQIADGPTTLTDVIVRPTDMLLEDPSLPTDIRQRITFRYAIRFDDLDVFPPDGGPELRALTLRSEKLGWHCAGRLNLSRTPSPYMLDGATHWLSTDVRVFKIRAGEARFGVTLNAGDPIGFLRTVLNAFDADPSLASHPYESLPTDQTASRLQLAETEGGIPVYNFAVCRVRYRALVSDAHQVRVHFRLFTTAATNLNWNPSTTYARVAAGGTNIARPGVIGGEVVTIPCFGRPRINLTSQMFSDQVDDTNEKSIAALPSGAEARRYFGAWLDINQPAARLPETMSPTDSGPFPAGSLKPITDLIRGRHQCLVAEVDFSANPITLGDSPANNDKLSQRNLAIEESDNPGPPDAHTVSMTFDIEPIWRFDQVGKLADLPDVNVTRAPAMQDGDAVQPHPHAAEHHEEDAGEAPDPHLEDVLAHMPPHHPSPKLIRGYRPLGDLLAEGPGLLRRDPVGVRFAPVAHEHRPAPRFAWFKPDELMIEWGEVPTGSTATLFIPAIETADIMESVRLRTPWPRFGPLDDHTLRLSVGGLTHIPLPSRHHARLAGLLTLHLPSDVRTGQSFRTVVRQVSNVDRTVMGAFELLVSVSTMEAIATDEARWYAVLQHIVQEMSPANRWHPVLSRLLRIVRARLVALGIDPERIGPSLNPEDIVDPDDRPCPVCGRCKRPGSGRPHRPHDEYCPHCRPVENLFDEVAEWCDTLFRCIRKTLE